MLFYRQECEFELTQKGDMVARLQLKASQIGKLLQTLEKSKGNGDASSSKSGTLTKQKSDSQANRKSLHIDPIPPFNASKIRKSPSAALTSDTLTTVTSPTTAQLADDTPTN